LLRILFLALLALVAFIAFEAYSGYRYYQDVREGSRSLDRVQDQLSLAGLTTSEQQVAGMRRALVLAGEHFESARKSLSRDPGLELASLIPPVDRQVDAAIALLTAAEELVRGGLEASEVFLAFVRYQESAPPSLRRGQAFIASQQPLLDRVDAHIAAAKSERAKVGGGLVPPIANARDEFDRTLTQMESLIAEYVLAATSIARSP
jgi:hypothetical protein